MLVRLVARDLHMYTLCVIFVSKYGLYYKTINTFFVNIYKHVYCCLVHSSVSASVSAPEHVSNNQRSVDPPRYYYQLEKSSERVSSVMITITMLMLIVAI